MTTGSSAQKAPGDGTLSVGEIARAAIVLLVLYAIPFLASGRLDWWAAWAYVGFTLLTIVGSRVLAARKNPDVLKERAGSLEAENVKPWDRIIVPVVAMLGPIAMLIVAGLDKRWGWSPPFAAWLQIAGLAGVLLGSAFGSWAMVVNRFFSGVVRIQAERGHTVVQDGPYRLVRHPGYAGGVVAWLAGPLALGSLWALIPAGLVVILTVVRTALEDRTLQAELPGYAEYAQRTRYRLLPGVW